MAAWEQDPIIESPISDQLLDSVRRVESGGNRWAVSSKGAKGPYQLMDDTAKDLNVEDPFDEDASRKGARAYLEQLHGKYGSVDKALLAYNWGPGNLDKFGEKKAPKESREYVQKVKSGLGKASWQDDPVVGESPNVPIWNEPKPPTKRASLGEQAIAAADFVAGIVPFVAQTIGVPGAAAVEHFRKPLPGEPADPWARAEQKVQSLLEPISKPFEKAARTLGFKGSTSETIPEKAMGKVGGWINDIGEKVEKGTGGFVSQAQFREWTNIAMLEGPRLAGKARDRLIDSLTKAAKPGEDLAKSKRLLEESLRTLGMDEPTARAHAEDIRDKWLQDQAEALMPEKSKPMTPAQAKRSAKEAKARVKGESDFAALAAEEQEARSQANVEREAREVAAKAADRPEPVETKVRNEYTRGVLLGQESAASKLGFQRTAEDLIQMHAQEALGREAIRRSRTDPWVKPFLADGTAKKLGIAAAGLGLGLIGWHEMDDETKALLGLGAGMVLAVKPKGGMWHPRTVTDLAGALEPHGIWDWTKWSMEDVQRRLADPNTPEGERLYAQDMQERHYRADHADRIIARYLNKHAGTSTDPLKDIVLPGGERWEEQWDKAIKSYTGEKLPGVRPDEPVWRVGINNESTEAIKSYLSHVGDWLRANVPVEKLGQFDLVRAVKETAAHDEKMAREAVKDVERVNREKAVAQENLPVYKEYPEHGMPARSLFMTASGSRTHQTAVRLPKERVGFKWVDLAVPKALTPEQARSVRSFTEAPKRAGQDARFVALDASGKPIVDKFSDGFATGKTPEEAWLAGQLALEGNVMGHCVGGYCRGVARGEQRILSLRDSKGRSYATVEVRPAWEPGKGRTLPSFDKAQEGVQDRIEQIKGPGNGPPPDYVLPMVQDLVRSGQWGEVKDLQHAQLTRTKDGRFLTQNELQREPLQWGQQAGKADPHLLGALAAVGIGAAAGAALDPENPTRGALTLAAIVGGGLAGIKAFGKVMDSLSAKLENIPIGPRDNRYRIDEIRMEFENREATGKLAGMQATTAIKALVSGQKARERLTLFMQDGRVEDAPKVEEELALVKHVAARMEAQLAREQRFGVMPEGIGADPTYVAQFWQGGRNKVREIIQTFSRMSPKNPHAMSKVLPSYRVGMELGFKPKTLDLAEIVGMRIANGERAIARQRLIDELKSKRIPDMEVEGGRPVLAPADQAGPGYVPSPHPQLTGLRIHPDIEPTMQLLFSYKEPNAILDALSTLSAANKLAIFSFSLFHPKSLADVMGGISVARLIGYGPAAWKFLPQAHREWLAKDGTLLHDAMVKGQLKFEPRAGIDAEGNRLLDVSKKLIDSSAGWFSLGRAGITAAGAVYGATKDKDNPLEGALLGAAIAFGGGRKGLQAARWLYEKNQQFLWGYIHPVSKIATFGAEFETALRRNAERAEMGQPTKSEALIAREVGASVNDLYGGIQWGQIAEGVKNRYGRNLATALAGPTSQQLLGILLQAPDWTASTIRGVMKAIPGVSSREGAAISRAYVFGSMLIFATFADALNLHYTGKHFWENKDPTRVDRGDGTSIQLNKHFMEVFHWIQSPGQTLLNKLAILPTEVPEQIFGKEYFSTKSQNMGPPMDTSWRGRVLHLLGRFAPITASQETGEKALWGAMGVPIYGRNPEEMAEFRSRIRAIEKKRRQEEGSHYDRKRKGGGHW